MASDGLNYLNVLNDLNITRSLFQPFKQLKTFQS